MVSFCCSHLLESHEMSLASSNVILKYVNVWHSWLLWVSKEPGLASQLFSRPESALSLMLGQFVFLMKLTSFRWCFNVFDLTLYYICFSHLSSSIRRFWHKKGQCSCHHPRGQARLSVDAHRHRRKKRSQGIFQTVADVTPAGLSTVCCLTV